MKKLEAIIRPFKLEEVKEALSDLGIHGMTVSEVRKFGGQKPHLEVYRGFETNVDFVREIKVEVVLPDPLLAEAKAVMVKASQPNKLGGGRILVSALEEVC